MIELNVVEQKIRTVFCQALGSAFHKFPQAMSPDEGQINFAWTIGIGRTEFQQQILHFLYQVEPWKKGEPAPEPMQKIGLTRQHEEEFLDAMVDLYSEQCLAHFREFGFDMANYEKKPNGTDD